jgi:hypothetical protein
MKPIMHFNLFALVDYNPHFIRRRDPSKWLMVKKTVHNIKHRVQNIIFVWSIFYYCRQLSKKRKTTYSSRNSYLCCWIWLILTLISAIKNQHKTSNSDWMKNCICTSNIWKYRSQGDVYLKQDWKCCMKMILTAFFCSCSRAVCCNLINGLWGTWNVHLFP